MVLFERYDANYDGKIDLDEAAKMVRDMLPATRQRVSDEWVRVRQRGWGVFGVEAAVQGQARRMMVQMDLDHDGHIDLEEFLIYARANPEVR